MIGYPFDGVASVGNGTMRAFLAASPEQITSPARQECSVD